MADTVKTTESWVLKPNGIEIYTRTWEPADPASIVAVVVMLHGLGEHIQRYNHVFPHFARAGIKVFGFDQRGFGRTVRRCGQLGDSQGLDTVMNDVKDAVAAARVGDKPLFVMGQSMGGALALLFASRHPDGVRGVISTGPSAAPKGIEPLLLRFVPYIAPNISVKNTVAASILHMGNELQTVHSKTFKTPVIIVHGSKDLITSPTASKAFHDAIPSTDKTYVALDGYLHEGEVASRLWRRESRDWADGLSRVGMLCWIAVFNELGDMKNPPVKTLVEWVLAHSRD
nr:hypothetical protein HK105_000624 [Polyrhizophydium stewartii]